MDEGGRATWATRVRQARVDAELTQGELAERAGVSARTIRDMERGTRVPQRDTLLSVLNALRLDDHPGPQFDADLDALLVLIGSLVKRLPVEFRSHWAEHVTKELIVTIRLASSDGDPLRVNAGHEARRLAEMDNPPGEEEEGRDIA